MEQKLLKRKSKASGSNSALVSACTDLASYYASTGRHSKAINEYHTLCDIYKEEKNLILYAQANRGIGEAHMGLQQFDQALKHFKVYYEVAVEEKDVREQQRALAQLGHLYLTWFLEGGSESDRGLLDEAYKYLIKSMKTCEGLPDGTEKQDMLARLFSNLGLVKEQLGDYQISLNLYQKSINICQKFDNYEQLYRGYLSMASLYERQEKYQETVKNYNLAIEVAKKLSLNRAELICAALLAKSGTLIKIADFQGAKQVLRKAYKFKTPNKEEARLIEKYLRVVAAMCKIEDEIITCNDQKHLKRLYEQMGDGACDLKNFTKALEYYRKMLEVAEKSGASDKELGECYYSLGETYRDTGNFKEAEIYFEKEYALCTILKDSLNTICKLADLKETANHDPEEIKKVYERGLANCKKKRNLKEEKRLVLRYADFLRRSLQHKDAFKMEQHLNSLNEQSGNEESSSSDYESEDSAKVHVGDDVALSDITDLSEESEDELVQTTSKRRKQSSVKFKKNLNGEWPLHVACIKGNLKMVQYWLGVDHPVNVRDNAGWLPLHEAAVHGHLDIVRLLLDHKASINDRGGAECNGITPLHDAASNGHLDVMELLLERGASALAKTDDGNTALFELKRWHERSSEADFDGALYTKLVKRMQEALDKAGQKDLEPENSAEKWLEDDSRPQKSKKRKSELWRRSSSESRSPEGAQPPSQTSEKRASTEYLEVMQSLRHKTQSVVQGAPKAPPSALVDAEGFVDSEEWLEDDLRPQKPKKRRTNLWGRSSSFGGASSSNEPAKKRPTQVTLMDSGFSRERTRASQVPGLNRTALGQPKIPNCSVEEADSTTLPKSPFKVRGEAPPTIADPMTFVDVEIEGRAFRVPVLMSQIQQKTIKWLALEAAHRYESKEYMRPVLELETTSGAILGDSDSLSLLFPLGTVQAERVVGKVIEWNLSSVLERYKETCANMGIDPDRHLSDFLQTLSIDLDVSNRGFPARELCPLLKSINNQKALTNIDLSGNFLSAQGASALCSSLVTLPNLESLNLSCTGLQNAHLSQLASALAPRGGALTKLSNLDLSDNISLKGACLKELDVISNSLTLRRLNLSNIALGDLATFQGAVNLKGLEDLDLSFNQLDDQGLRRIMNWVDGKVLKRLNVSRNRGKRALRQILDALEGEAPWGLEEAKLEACGVGDGDLFELLDPRLAPSLMALRLSYNPDLTSISLRRLLERDSLHCVDVTSCDRIWDYFDGGTEAFRDCIVRGFRDRYGGRLEARCANGRLAVEVNLH